MSHMRYACNQLPRCRWKACGNGSARDRMPTPITDAVAFRISQMANKKRTTRRRPGNCSGQGSFRTSRKVNGRMSTRGGISSSSRSVPTPT